MADRHGRARRLRRALLITAYRSARPGDLAPLEYLGIPFSFALGWAVFDEAPFDRLWPGAPLIVGAGLLIIWRERVHARRAA